MRTSYLKPLFLLTIFLFPLILSGLMFHFHKFFHFKMLNHGHLINPPIHFRANRKWQIVYVPGNHCDTSCQSTLFNLRQIRKALGKDSPRIYLTLMTTDHPLQAPGFNHLMLSQQQFIELQNKLALATQHDFIMTGKILLVDPIGNLFIYYPSTTNPMNVLKDMKKVLDVSQIG